MMFRRYNHEAFHICFTCDPDDLLRCSVDDFRVSVFCCGRGDCSGAESKRALFSELFPIGKIIEDSLLSSDFKYHESLIDTENPNIMKELIIVYKKNAEEPSPQVVKDIQDKIEKGNLKRDGIPQQYFLITITGRVCNR